MNKNILIFIALIAYSLSRRTTHDAKLEEKYQLKHIQEGDGQNYPDKNQRVHVHYTGRLMDGKVFDSSVERGKSFSFRYGIGQVIKCWDEVVGRMSIGEKVSVVCPSEYAYGERGAGGIIPPNADLKFEIELLKIDQRVKRPDL